MRATQKANSDTILFFLWGSVPSEKAQAKAAEVEKSESGTVFFRNGAVPHGEGMGALEVCDMVCGAVPEPYKAAGGPKVLFETKRPGSTPKAKASVASAKPAAAPERPAKIPSKK